MTLYNRYLGLLITTIIHTNALAMTATVVEPQRTKTDISVTTKCSYCLRPVNTVVPITFKNTTAHELQKDADLFAAATLGDVQAIRELYRNNAHINRTFNGLTSLGAAIIAGQQEAVEELLTSGAQTHHVKDSRSALDLAIDLFVRKHESLDQNNLHKDNHYLVAATLLYNKEFKSLLGYRLSPFKKDPLEIADHAKNDSALGLFMKIIQHGNASTPSLRRALNIVPASSPTTRNLLHAHILHAQ